MAILAQDGFLRIAFTFSLSSIIVLKKMTDVFNFNKGALTAIPTILYPTPKQKSASAIVQKNNAETLRENVKTP